MKQEPRWLIRRDACRRRPFGERAITRCLSSADRDIDPADVLRALAAPYRRERQPDGRWRQWILVARNGRWLRVVTEADGETVHNTFWDRGFKP